MALRNGFSLEDNLIKYSLNMFSTRKKAILIGIDDYKPHPLPGCCNDARMLGGLLSRHENGMKNYEVELLVSDSGEVTNQDVRNALERNLTSRFEQVLLYFSGHARKSEIGVFFQTMSQDWGVPFQEIMDSLQRSRIPNIILVLDCCFSGALGDLPILEREFTFLRSGLSIFASSHSAVSAIQSYGRGLFTEMILNGLKGGASDLVGNVYLSSVFSFVSSMNSILDHQPILKAYSNQMTLIRKAQPKVEATTLRRLGEYFLNSDELSLDPSYEKTLDPRNIKKEQILDDLRVFRNAGLVKPSGAISLYEAIIHQKHCTLTELGKYYRNMIRGNVI